MRNEETIAAISTPRGTGGVAIIRLSGPQSWAIGQALAKKKSDAKYWYPGQVLHDWLVDPEDGKVLDEVLFLPFKAPHSFTGEDCVEIHCHGGLVLSKLVLNCCFKLRATPAEAGAFSKQAFLNGKMDLTQSEALLDLIHGEGEALIKLSANNLSQKTISKHFQHLLHQITHVQADLTASIDFPDEVEEPDRLALCETLNTLVQRVQTSIQTAKSTQYLREGIEIVIMGPPNAGKSSLFNALLSSERSIVTEIEGTTRDIIRETLSIRGIPVTLIDTAGLRETQDRVEIIGVERSWQAIETAQALIYVYDAAVGLTEADTKTLASIQHLPGMLIANKADLVSQTPTKVQPERTWATLSVSTQTLIGLDAVILWLDALVEALPQQGELEYVLSQRQIQTLESVLLSVQDSIQALSSPHLPIDLATVPLTEALQEIQALLGLDTTEGVLDSVFHRFCVGK